ncbi:MAG: DUF4160 domain-containing protein [Gemmatimonadetes bacterium]|nr:DUF4160 domain-containing protein [Gemmatimonadota bacterium]
MSPTVLRAAGFRLYFYSRETREAPHVHVEKAGCVAKYWLAPVRLAEAFGFSTRELTRIERIVTRHRSDLLESWHAYFKTHNER